VDEVDIGNVRVGQAATVVADAYPDDRVRGEVVRIAPLGKTQQNVTTFSVLVLVRNVSGRLKAGMSTTVDVEIFRRQGVLLVPMEALKDPQSEEGKQLLAALRELRPGGDGGADTAAAGPGPGGGGDFDALREKLKNASPEERRRVMQEARREWEKSLEKLSPEEREKAMARRRAQMQEFRSRMGGNRGEGGGTPSFGDPSAGGQIRVRRASQADADTDVKKRLVEVKENGEYVPREIRVGAGNFDFAEVVEGLAEGDELRYTTLSRAKIAAERMNERLRSSQGIGGMGATGGTGGGRR
jgi:HlyD family secretion protein